MKKKIAKLQIFRIIVQLAFLVLLPGLFTLAFSGLGKLYSMIIKGNFNFVQAFPSLIELIVLIPLTLISGRFFCGWFCAFGSFNDFIYIISKNIFKTKFRINEKLDAALKYIKYIVLLFIAIEIWTFGSHLYDTSSPWDAFAQIGQFPQSLSDYAIGFILLALIVLGAIFVERFFCRYLCPLGAVFALVPRLRIFKISKPNEKCGKCRLCTNSCSMGLQLYKVNKVSSGECINCLKCIEACPRKNTQASILGENINPVLVSSAAIAAFTGIYSLNNMAAAAINKSSVPISLGTNTVSVNNPIADSSTSSANASTSSKGSSAPQSNNAAAKNGSIPPAKSNTTTAVNNTAVKSSAPQVSSSTVSKANNTTGSQNNGAVSSTSQQKKYKDGTFTGTATGYRPGLQVAVTIKNDKIQSVQIVSINDTPRFYQQAASVIPQEIVQNQSTNVDAVSGATRSSNGIIRAVQNALNQAKL